MKANELMVGDLVMASLHANEYQVCKVVCLEGYREAVAVYDIKDEDEKIIGRWAKDLKPIPLSEEILKVNGWEKNKFSSAYINHGVPSRIDIGVSDIWLDHEWDDYYNAFSFQYVHQLQHALRLCGLNELADNFKVE